MLNQFDTLFPSTMVWHCCEQTAASRIFSKRTNHRIYLVIRIQNVLRSSVAYARLFHKASWKIGSVDFVQSCLQSDKQTTILTQATIFIEGKSIHTHKKKPYNPHNHILLQKQFHFSSLPLLSPSLTSGMNKETQDKKHRKLGHCWNLSDVTQETPKIIQKRFQQEIVSRLQITQNMILKFAHFIIWPFVSPSFSFPHCASFIGYFHQFPDCWSL